MSSKHSEAMGDAETAPKRYLVACDECAFETAARGHDEAAERVAEHATETGHEIVALEYPPNKLEP